MVGCLVLDTAPQGKRGGHHQQHSPPMFSSDSGHVALESCCVVAVCQCGGGVPGPRHTQGKREGGGVGHHQQDSPLIVPWALDGIHVASCHISPFPEKGAGCTLGDGKYLEVVVCQEEERSVKASSCCHRSVEASSYCVRTLLSNTVT